MKHLSLFMAVGSVLFSAVACSDSTVAADAPGADLDGTWKSACFNSARAQLVYTNLKLAGTYTEYSDASCTTPRHVAAWTATATAGAVATGGVRPLDLAFESFRSTPLTDAEAELVNTNTYCGLTDWAKGVEKDILGRECYGLAIPKGGKSLDVYRIDEGNLRFGVGAKISTSPVEADRPSAIDETRVFTKRVALPDAR